MPDDQTEDRPKPRKYGRIKTPTVLQMEAVECGAAALAMILAHYGLFVPLERLRIDCGISRDGSKASNVIKAARKYGLIAKGFKMELEEVYSAVTPCIVFWNFNHFVVLEGFKKGFAYLNDPGGGQRCVTEKEFDSSFTGVVLTFEPGPEFKKGGEKQNIYKSLAVRLKGSQSALVYVILISLMLVIPGLVIPVFSRVFIDNILIGKMDSYLYPLLWGMGITMLLRAILTWLQQNYLSRLQTKFAITSATKFFWHVLHLPVEFFTQRFAGDISGRVETNNKIATLLSGNLSTNAINLLMLIFYAAVMFNYDILLTFIGLGMAVLNFVVLKYVSRKHVDITKRMRQDEGKLSGTSMNGLQVIETLKATGSEADFFSKWAGYFAKVITARQENGVPVQILTVAPGFLTNLTNAIIIFAGGLRVIDGSMSAGTFVAYQGLMASFLAPVNQLVTLGTAVQETEADINRLDDVLRYKTDDCFHEEAAMPPGTASKLSGALELREVTFGYSLLEPPLIENFSLSLKPGARVALVGGSGSGKSTVAKVVSGLYKPWSGTILFDGKPRGDIPRDTICNSIAMVDQDIFLFEGSIRDNLTMWDTTLPEQSVIEAAKDACIHEDVAARAGAYDNLMPEGGSNFSGGQRQRLEIARALATQPAIVILDEATSALDSKTEEIIDGNLRRRGCTCLIIAHRLSTIRDCDEIIVLEKGKVMQRGTHEELLEAGGLYSELIKQT